MRTRTITIQDRDTTDALLDQHMDDLDDRGINGRRLQFAIRAQVAYVLQRYPQQLCICDVDGDELEDSVLSQHANDERSLCVIVDVDDGDSPRPRLEHASAGFVEGP